MHTPQNLEHRRPSSFVRLEPDKKIGIFFFVISFIIHGVVFSGMLFFQDFSFPKPLPPVIQVDLVSFDPEPVLAKNDDAMPIAAEGDIPLKAKAVESKPKPVRHIKADISLKTKPKNLKELIEKERQKKNKPPEEKPEKKEEPEPEKKTEAQPDKEKKQEDSKKEVDQKAEEDENREKIATALSRLQKTVAVQGSSRQEGAKKVTDGRGRKGHKPIDLYKLLLGTTIQQNWVYTDILAGMDQNLEVRILIKILKSGEIRDIIYETRSGNRYLDESAKKAIKKSNPLPELPAGRHSYDVVIIFTPKGLR